MSKELPPTPSAQENTAPLPNAISEAEIANVVEGMRKISSGAVQSIMPSEKEIAGAIIDLHDTKGAKAAVAFIERMLGPKPRLLGYEKAILKKHIPPLAAAIDPLSRRKFISTATEIGAGYMTAMSLTGLLPDSGKEKVAQTLDNVNETIYNVNTQMSEQTGAPKPPPPPKSSRQGKINELKKYMQDHPSPEKMPPDEQEAFYAAVEERIAKLAKPQERNIGSRLLTLLAISSGIYFSDKSRRSAKKEMEKYYINVASYIAHKTVEASRQNGLAESTGPTP